ncbi:hypothetical protein B0H14DRAFT_3528074 [Mycena olivaceomarginata]|nr:hypothetical protein B0H14DRAFT_3528074 [Mycena olivaceomarginata]
MRSLAPTSLAKQRLPFLTCNLVAWTPAAMRFTRVALVIYGSTALASASLPSEPGNENQITYIPGVFVAAQPATECTRARTFEQGKASIEQGRRKATVRDGCTRRIRLCHAYPRTTPSVNIDAGTPVPRDEKAARTSPLRCCFAERDARRLGNTGARKEQAKSWQGHYTRIEQDRCGLSTELLTVSIPIRPDREPVESGEPHTGISASTSSNRPPAHKSAIPPSPTEPDSPLQSVSAAQRQQQRNPRTPASTPATLPPYHPADGSASGSSSSAGTPQRAAKTSAAQQQIQTPCQPSPQIFVRRAQAVIHVKEEDGDDGGGQLDDLEDERIQYVLIDDNIILHAATQRKLRACAAQWRGFSALEPTLPPHAGPYALRLRRATASGPGVTTPALFILYHLVHTRHPPAHLRLAHRPPRDPTHST